MKILKQPSGMDFTQPLLNKVLRVHLALMHSSRGGTSATYYDSESREQLDWNNWRVRLIRKFGT